MSFLAPLFAAGVLAVSLPILFHLIRRTPRGEVPFSTLMFLSPSPPRLTRRSRLEHLLLLLLRGLALTLLALAFARPFLRQAYDKSFDDTLGRQVAILLDVSASMQSGDAWLTAQAEVNRILAELSPADEVALFTFAERLETVVPLPEATQEKSEPHSTRIRQRMKTLAPGWGSTDIGTALTALAEQLDNISDQDEETREGLQIILISDLQQGAKTEALQAYEWPQHIKLQIEAISATRPSNASLRLLTQDPDAEESERLPVRVSNAGNSKIEQFKIGWAADDQDDSLEDAMDVYVPPGQSRIVRMARPLSSGRIDRLRLTGDDCEFDNSFYVVPPHKEKATVWYAGSESPETADGMRYFLNKALSVDPHREVMLIGWTSEDDDSAMASQPPRMCVVTDTITSAQSDRLKDYVQQGGTVLCVVSNNTIASSVAGLVGPLDLLPPDADSPSARKTDYAMIGEVDFTHPLMAVFASPRYNDFTKVRFWQHARITLPDESDVRMIAKFDDGHPAWFERTLGRGRVYVMASGWHPEHSQLALSTKFLPLMVRMLELAGRQGLAEAQYTVGQAVVLPEDFNGPTASAAVRKADGVQVPLMSDQTVFEDTDQPGIYQLVSAESQLKFAVNTSSSESDLQPLNKEQLEQFGVNLGTQLTKEEQIQRKRQLRDIELESKQQMWRWLIVVALGLLLVETWLAGLHAKRAAN